MAKIVDARGLACPQPVILTRNALREAEAVTTIVDDDTPRINVTRMAEKAGHAVSVEEKADGIYIHITRSGEAPQAEAAAGGAGGGPAVVFFTKEGMGSGPKELETVLIRGFLHTLNEVAPRPDTLVFVTDGVKLAVDGSPVLDDLRALEEQGVDILVCGTCLNYFELKDKLAVGQVSNMYDIAETLLRAGNVVRV